MLVADLTSLECIPIADGLEEAARSFVPSDLRDDVAILVVQAAL